MDVREKLVELLERAFESFIDDPYCIPDERKFADHLIAHGVTVQEWISVKDRLPDVNTNRSGYESKGVIVCIDGGEKISYRVYERTWIRGKSVCRWKYPWDTISDENITHWMPLPDALKGE